MRVTLQHASHIERIVNAAVPLKGIAVGLTGGLLSTLAMDIFRIVVFPVLGVPVNLSFSLIGDTAAGFFSVLGISVTGGVPLGVVLYYLIGLMLGGIFATTVCSTDAFRVTSMEKKVGLSILCVEIMSLPLLASASILLKMPASETMQWFGISFVMHLIYGLVLGGVAGYGLRREP